MKKTALTLILASGILAGCGSSSAKVETETAAAPETGVAPTVACLKEAGATIVERDKTWPYTTITVQGSNQNLILLATSSLDNPRFGGVKQSISQSVPGSRFQTTDDGRTLVAFSPTTPSEDMGFALDCASRLASETNPHETQEENENTAAAPQQLAAIERACGLEAGTARQTLRKQYGGAPPGVLNAVERLATETPKSFCPTLEP